MVTKKDLSKLSKDEIIQQFLEYQDQKEAEIRDLRMERDAALKRIEAKTHIIKLQNRNKFVGTSESNKKIVINEAEKVISETKVEKRGRPKGSTNFSNVDLESLVTKVEINDINDKICDKCGDDLISFGEDIAYKIRKIPSKIEVTKVITPKYKCPNCEGKIYQALSNNVFSKSMCTPSLAADIIDKKLDLGVPFDRYAKYLNDQNIPLSKVDLCNYFLAADKILQPVYFELKKCLSETKANVIHADETTLQVLDYKNIDRKYGYVFVYVTSYYDNPIYLYSFNQTRETKETEELLDNYGGYLVCDGFKGYDILKEKNIKLQRCFAHIRRYFYDIVKTLKDSQKRTSKALKMVNLIDDIFVEERNFIENHLTSNEIHKMRHSNEYQLKLNRIYEFLHTLNPEEGTPLNKAVKYFLQVEDDSKTFLEDGHIPISNNIAERAIKPFAICRRNFLFAKSENGALSTGRLFSLLQTAKANGLSPESYLAFALENINNLKPDQLLPWSEEVVSKVKSINY